MALSQQEATIKGMYADLFDSLNLSPELRDEVLAELFSKQSAMMEAGMSLMDPNLSEEEKKAAQDMITTAQKDSSDKIAALLGPDNFKTFTRFEASAPDRMQLQSVRESMSAVGSPLTEVQEQSLMDLMYEERTRPQVAGAADTAVQPGSSPEQMESVLSQQSELNARIIQRATAVLNPSQIEILRKGQQQMIEMQRMGIEMMKGMTGKDSPTP